MGASVDLCLQGGLWHIDNEDASYVFVERHVARRVVLRIMMSRDEFNALCKCITGNNVAGWSEAVTKVAD